MKDPTYRYTITLEAGALDPEGVRQVLESALGASAVDVHVQALPRPLKDLRLSSAEAAVVALLGDLKAHRLKEIVAVLGARASPPHVITLLRGLIDVDVVRKVGHGVYALAAAPEDIDIPRANNNVLRQSEARVLDWLRTPLLASEIRDRLGVSRQRVDQILKGLEGRGVVARHRTTGEAGAFLYVRSDAKITAGLVQRTPKLPAAKARLLSALRADRLVRVSDATETLNSYPHVVLANARHLERQGLVTLFKLGDHHVLTLTPLGLAHPQHKPVSGLEAREANVHQAFGAVRTTFLQILHVLGPLRTLDLTYAAPEALLKSEIRSSGQFVRALAREGLVEPLPSSGQPQYALTARGALAAGLIGLAHPPPSADHLLAHIGERRARRREGAGDRVVAKDPGRAKTDPHQQPVGPTRPAR